MKKIKGVRKVKEAKAYYVLDFETTTAESLYYQTNGEARVIYFAIRKLWDANYLKEGISIEELEEWLDNQEEEAIIFCHNLAKFDGWYLLSYAKDNWNSNIKSNGKFLKRYSFFQTKQGFIKINIVNKRKVAIQFQDSLALLSNSVSNLGKALGLPKLETDYNIEPVSDINQLPKEYKEYCIRDCDIVRLSLESFYANVNIFANRFELDINPFKLTAASLARDIIEGLDRWNYFKIDCKDFKKGKEFYRGGLTSFNCKFQQLKNHSSIYIFDVKSHYPSVMHNRPLPMGSPKVWDNPKTYKRDKSHLIVFVKVKYILKKNKTNWGMLYIYNKDEIELDRYYYIFEESRIENYFWGLYEEWELISKHYYEFWEWEYQEVYYYTDTHNTLNPMLEYFYELKEKNKDAKLTSKIILNSSYGSMGMNYNYPEVFYSNDNDINIGDTVEIDNKEYWIYHKKNKHLYSKDILAFEALRDVREIKNISVWNVWAAATITAWGRVIIMERVLKDVNNNIYCDTDSVITMNNKIFNKEELGSNMGQWELEAEGDYMELLGQKKYQVYKNGKVIKGAFNGLNPELKYVKGILEQEEIEGGKKYMEAKEENNYKPVLITAKLTNHYLKKLNKLGGRKWQEN